MSINLEKNKDALVAAWKSVVDDKSPINWAVFSYEGQTNNLKVISTGSNGLEEMIEELNSGLIMYAFCRVIDVKTTLPKCLLINWQGEGAPIVRKGTCANHIRDIEKLLKGAHITVNARSEEDVEIDLIMNKLSRATASFYKFNEPRAANGHSTSIGTTYKKVIPAQEINASERDQFWQKEEIEEKKRLEAERTRQEQDRKKLDEEIRRREEKESKFREQQIIETQKKEQFKVNERTEDIVKLRKQNIALKNGDSDDEQKSKSDELRRERSKEAQQLIAQRTINARAIFEQNSSASQTRVPIIQQQKRNNVSAVKKTFEENQNKADIIHTENKQILEDKLKISNQPSSQDNLISHIPQIIPSEAETQVPQPYNNGSEIKIQYSESNKNLSPENNSTIKTNEDKVNIAEENVKEISENTNDALNDCYEQSDTTQYLYLDPDNKGTIARALYDYEAADETEITFDPGDIITHIDIIDEGWWQGLGPDGTYGLFPANHVEVIEYASK